MHGSEERLAEKIDLGEVCVNYVSYCHSKCEGRNMRDYGAGGGISSSSSEQECGMCMRKFEWFVLQTASWFNIHS
jgi:hypothetical protein